MITLEERRIFVLACSLFAIGWIASEASGCDLCRQYVTLNCPYAHASGDSKDDASNLLAEFGRQLHSIQLLNRWVMMMV